MKQPDVVGLLSVGSAAAPKEDVLQIGDAGQKQLVSLKEEGEKGLSAFFQKETGAAKGVLGPNGLPPLPTSRAPNGPKRYEMLKEQSYGTKYVFTTVRTAIRGSRMLTIYQLPLQDICLDFAFIDSDHGAVNVYAGFKVTRVLSSIESAFWL